MRRQEKAITDETVIQGLLEQGKYAMIAMCRDNEPYIVTLSYGYDHKKRTLYFHSASTGLKLDFIKANPKVCATVIEDRGYIQDECDHSYSSVVLFGNMSIVEALEEKIYGMEIMLNHLEENPQPIRDRNFKNMQAYDKVCMMKLEIEEITAKKGS